MGQKLVLNMNDHGFTVAVYNRSADKVDAFLAGSGAGHFVKMAHNGIEYGDMQPIAVGQYSPQLIILKVPGKSVPFIWAATSFILKKLVVNNIL